MSLVKTWFTPQEAEEKFGVERARILGWVEQGVVRAEMEGKKVVLINADDLQLKMEELDRR
jgi:hypothetical protein